MKTVSKKLLSLLLVAILLVSALPFQAFAAEPVAESAKEAHDENNATHVSSVWESDATGHWHLCPNANCEEYGKQLNFNTHTFNANGVCTVCTYACAHSNTTTDSSTAQAATCVKAGKEADTVCADCGKVLSTGATIPATGIHNYVNYVCTECGATQQGASFKLTLDANGGTINGAASAVVDVKKGSAISVLPTPTKQGATFAGWFITDDSQNEIQISLGQTYNFDSDKTAVAKWTEVTYQLTVRRVLNANNATAKTLLTVNVPAGTPLLNYLNANVTSTINAELAVTPGYTWQYNYWYDYSGTQPLTDQTACMNQAQTVVVNFVANSYTLYFNANGGSVTPSSKTVYFGSAVGTLPTPSLSGKVFQGWKDANGNMYDASTIYQIAGDTSLTAVWQDEAMVLLYIYVNGDFSTYNRMILMDGYVKNNNISRSDVVAQVTKYYTSSYGNLSIAGLFDDYTWSSYRANTSKAGTENIQIDSSKVNKIYVMVNNANTGITVLPTTPTLGGTTGSTTTTTPSGAYWVSTGNGTGYWVYPAPGSTTTTIPTYIYVGTNPKTGDTAKIEVAAAVMVLAAAALVTMMALRKKKA